METVVVEVCHRSMSDEYHACIGDTARWSGGRTVESSILNLMRTHPEPFRLTANERIRASGVGSPAWLILKDLLTTLSRRLNVEVRFLPTTNR